MTRSRMITRCPMTGTITRRKTTEKMENRTMTRGRKRRVSTWMEVLIMP